jgi:hypothetical protein
MAVQEPELSRTEELNQMIDLAALERQNQMPKAPDGVPLSANLYTLDPEHREQLARNIGGQLQEMRQAHPQTPREIGFGHVEPTVESEDAKLKGIFSNIVPIKRASVDVTGLNTLLSSFGKEAKPQAEETMSLDAILALDAEPASGLYTQASEIVPAAVEKRSRRLFNKASNFLHKQAARFSRDKPEVAVTHERRVARGVLAGVVGVLAVATVATAVHTVGEYNHGPVMPNTTAVADSVGETAQPTPNKAIGSAVGNAVQVQADSSAPNAISQAANNVYQDYAGRFITYVSETQKQNPELTPDQLDKKIADNFDALNKNS